MKSFILLKSLGPNIIAHPRNSRYSNLNELDRAYFVASIDI